MFSGGCMNEVTEVIAFLLLGRLVVGNTTEIGIPLIKSAWARARTGSKAKAEAAAMEEAKKGHHEQWIHDANADQLELDGRQFFFLFIL